MNVWKRRRIDLGRLYIMLQIVRMLQLMHRTRGCPCPMLPVRLAGRPRPPLPRILLRSRIHLVAFVQSRGIRSPRARQCRRENGTRRVIVLREILALALGRSSTLDCF